MSQSRKPRDEILSNISDLEQQAQRLAILCLSGPTTTIDVVAQKLLSKKPSIFTILQQPFLKAIRQQLIAIARYHQHTALAETLAEDTAATPIDLLPKSHVPRFIGNFLKPLGRFTQGIKEKMREAGDKQDSKTIGQLIPLIDEESFQEIGHHLLIIAVMKNYPPTVALLAPRLNFSNYRATIESDGVLHYAALHDTTEILELLTQQSIKSTPITKGNSRKFTPLHYAAQKNNVAAVRLLLPLCDVNAQSIEGCTALYAATQKGNSEVVKLLLSAPHSADIMLSLTANGSNPLHLASEYGFNDIVRMFLSKMTPTQIVKERNNGSTALYLAGINNRVETVQLLLPHFSTKHKIDIFEKFVGGIMCVVHTKKALHKSDEQFAILSSLVDNMDKIPARLEKIFLEFLYVAIQLDRLDIIGLLQKKLSKQSIITKPIKSWYKDNPAITVIHMAALWGKTEALKFLTESYTAEEINHELPESASTPLHLAVQSGHIDTTAYLLTKLDAAIIVKLLVNGLTSPLHSACIAKNPDMVRFFLSKLTSEQANTKTIEGQTPLQFAIDQNSSELTQLFLNHLTAEHISTNLNALLIEMALSFKAKNIELISTNVNKLKFLLIEINKMASFPEQLHTLYLDIIPFAIEHDLPEIFSLVIDKIPPEKLAMHVPRTCNMPALHLAAITAFG